MNRLALLLKVGPFSGQPIPYRGDFLTRAVVHYSNGIGVTDSRKLAEPGCSLWPRKDRQGQDSDQNNNGFFILCT